jgi:hypothetical protein
MTVKDEVERCGNERPWPNLRYKSVICLKKLRKTTEKPEQLSVSGSDLNRLDPGHKPDGLPLKPNYSVEGGFLLSPATLSPEK